MSDHVPGTFLDALKVLVQAYATRTPKRKDLGTVSERYRINPDKIVYETFGNEVLVINLDIGTYHSLTGASSRLWAILVSGAPAEAIVTALTRAHDHDPGLMADAVREFLGRLTAENLVEQDASPDAFAPQDVTEMPCGSKTPFTGFELSTFTDMQDLLLLDPIHDVEEAGWPLTKPAALDPNDT
jgi:hypothetical protein